jgi:muramoyltetrapeptide carboxypeptidase
MELIVPSALRKGDTIAIIAPSGGLAVSAPHRLENAKKYLESEGYSVRLFPCTQKKNDYESAPPKERAEEIMSAFTDPQVKAIVCQIGGTVLNKTLRYLDYDKIRKNPKILSGYSDISVLHYALHKQAGLQTYYGPCAMTQFGEFPKPLDYTMEYFYKAVADQKIGVVKPSEEWTDEVLNWMERKDLERARELRKNRGFEWLREGVARGNIIGGCLSSIVHLLGTPFWPDHKDHILFVELPEGDKFDKGLSLSKADAYLCDLELAGIFKEINGLIIGRPFRYSPEEEAKFKKIILDNTQGYNFPIMYGADVGHTDPQITIPLGKEVELDSSKNLFKFND